MGKDDDIGAVDLFVPGGGIVGFDTSGGLDLGIGEEDEVEGSGAGEGGIDGVTVSLGSDGAGDFSDSDRVGDIHDADDGTGETGSGQDLISGQGHTEEVLIDIEGALIRDLDIGEQADIVVTVEGNERDIVFSDAEKSGRDGELARTGRLLIEGE